MNSDLRVLSPFNPQKKETSPFAPPPPIVYQKKGPFPAPSESPPRISQPFFLVSLFGKSLKNLRLQERGLISCHSTFVCFFSFSSSFGRRGKVKQVASTSTPLFLSCPLFVPFPPFIPSIHTHTLSPCFCLGSPFPSRLLSEPDPRFPPSLFSPF